LICCTSLRADWQIAAYRGLRNSVSLSCCVAWEKLVQGQKLSDIERQKAFLCLQLTATSICAEETPGIYGVVTREQHQLLLDMLEDQVLYQKSLPACLTMMEYGTRFDKAMTHDAEILSKMLIVALRYAAKGFYLAGSNVDERKLINQAVTNGILKNKERFGSTAVNRARAYFGRPILNDESRPYALLMLGVLCNHLKRRADAISCLDEARRLVEERVNAAKSAGKAVNVSDARVLEIAEGYLPKLRVAPPSALAAASAAGVGEPADVGAARSGGSAVAQESKKDTTPEDA